MIIVISNRSLNLKNPIGDKPEIHPITVLGKNISNDGNVFGILKYDTNQKKEKIKLFPKGQENLLFADVLSKLNTTAEMKRPWILFVHGFNQTIQKNISKARNLEAREKGKVNVIVFAWPSQPDPGKTEMASRAIKKMLIKKLVKNNAASIALGSITKYITDYWKTYTLAKINAEQSTGALNSAFDVVQNEFIKHLPKKIPISLLVHSLGNFLMEKTVVANNIKPKFTYIILHQADCDTTQHKQWVPIITKNADNVFITANQYDSVLGASFIHNQVERLGQMQFGYLKHKKVIYCDFTGIPSSMNDDNTGECMNESDHGLFNLPLKRCAKDMYNLLSHLIMSKNSGLPTKDQYSKNGFRKTRKDRKSTRLNSSHTDISRMPSSA